MKNFFKTHKYIIIIGLLFFITNNFIIKTYIVPSSSMYPKLKIGDYYIGLKYEYGIKIPNLYLTNIKLFPNINENNYLYKFKSPKKTDILIFKQPLSNKTFVKRYIAGEKDEILLSKDNNIYIHKKEGDEYIKHNYKKDKYIKYKNKYWVKNEYISKIKTINYKANDINVFELLTKLYIKKESVKYLKENKDWEQFLTYDKLKKVFIYKLKKDEYFMVGDNRNNSIDSRFFGPINFKDIEAKFSKILFNAANNKIKQ
jgi:signal peptidase I